MCLVLAVACGGGESTGPSYNITGSWSGGASIQGANFIATVVINDAGGTLSGSGTISGAGPTCAITIAGTRTKDHVNLAFACAGFQAIVFNGTVNSDASIVQGNISGSGYPVTPFDLIRQ